MKTLKAFKNSIGTILINTNNEIVCFYPKNLTQPHRNSKKITHNCFTYNLEWIKTDCKKELHWFNQTMLAVSKKIYKSFFNCPNPLDFKFKEEIKKDSKNTPLEISFINPFQFTVKVRTKF